MAENLRNEVSGHFQKMQAVFLATGGKHALFQEFLGKPR